MNYVIYTWPDLITSKISEIKRNEEMLKKNYLKPILHNMYMLFPKAFIKLPKPA